MDEKMVICPKIGACQHPIPRFCGHDKPHVTKINCANTAGNCPACIPVPPTPASVPLPPDELLTDEIASFLLEQNKGTYPKSTYSNQAETILQKCHQSEAVKIKQLELGKKLSMESDNRIEQAIGKVLGYPAYKDDQKNFPNATEANGVCVGDHVAESLVMELVDRFKAIRADQNKKIGEWGNEPCPHRNNDFPFPKAVPSELQMPKRECRDCWQEKSGVAKLQKGDF